MPSGACAGLPDYVREERRIAAAYARRNERADAVRYSLFDPANLLVTHSCERQILRLLTQYGCRPLDGKKILEVGCGTGFWLREFIQWGARPENLAGVDLLADRLAEARQRCPAGVDLRCANAAALPFAEESFDLVLQATVFTSILDGAIKQQVAREMLRVLKPNGIILWYDFHVNNPTNPDVRGVGAAEIRRLFAGCSIWLKRTTLAPPIARRIAPYSWLACLVLGKIPLLCTHYLGVIRKPQGR